MDGLPLYFFQTDLRLEVDPTLFAGFLSAAAAFGNTVRADLVLTDLSLGELRLYFYQGEKALTVLGAKFEGYSESERVIKEFENLPRYQKLVKVLGNSFHQLYGDKIDLWDGKMDAFDDFETTIDLILKKETRFLEHKFLKLLAEFSKGAVSQAELLDAIWDIVEESESQ
jgi:hypothetical protein